MIWEGRKHFGLHLMIDGYGAKRFRLSNLSFIAEILEDISLLLKMTKIAPPYVFRYTGPKPANWGITGVLLIAESHISIHTFPEKSFITMDCYSCLPFDAEKVTNFMKESFSIVTLEVNLIERGGIPGE